jgi:hypothetical protein
MITNLAIKNFQKKKKKKLENHLTCSLGFSHCSHTFPMFFLGGGNNPILKKIKKRKSLVLKPPTPFWVKVGAKWKRVSQILF